MSSPLLDSIATSPIRKTKTLSKGAACVTCKVRKVRCDALKPGCTACRRSARWRGDDPDLIRCCYSERPSRRKGHAHHDDLLRHSRSSSASHDELHCGMASSGAEYLQHPPSTPPSPHACDFSSLPMMAIPSIPPVLAPASTFAPPDLPSPIPLPAPLALYGSTIELDPPQPLCGIPEQDNFLLDLSEFDFFSTAMPPWTPSLFADDLLAELDAALPFYASGMTKAPLPDVAPAADPTNSFTIFSSSSMSSSSSSVSASSLPHLSPSSSSSILHSPFSLIDHLPPSLPTAPTSAPHTRPRTRAAPPARIALPAYDPADPFAVAFGHALSSSGGPTAGAQQPSSAWVY